MRNAEHAKITILECQTQPSRHATRTDCYTPTLDASHTNAGFQTTSWGMIVDARADRSLLERLLRLYWPPVYAFIRHQGFGSHDASDLTQEFLSSVVLGRNMLDRADPQRGRFRSFLKQALRNFLIDYHRARSVRRDIAHPLSLSVGQDDTNGLGSSHGVPEPASAIEAADIFDRQWAATLVHLALERVEDALRAEAMSMHWEAFEINVVGPAIRKTRPLPLDALAQKLGVSDKDTVSNMIQTTKRRFKRTLREIVADTVENSIAVDDELAELNRLLGSG